MRHCRLLFAELGQHRRQRASLLHRLQLQVSRYVKITCSSLPHNANTFTGNMGGEYADNIEKPRGDATCYWNDGM